VRASIDAPTYRELLRRARKLSLRPDEAEDLLQTALLAALETNRGDLTRAENRRWLTGVLRYRALHEARSAARRRHRERTCPVEPDEREVGAASEAGPFIAALPPALRTTALLALAGHTKPEIAWLLRLSDTTLRKRLSDIRRRWSGAALGRLPGFGEPRGDLAFGRIRRALLGRTRDTGAILATHDPDGHLFVVSSQNGGARQPRTDHIGGQGHVR